MEKMKILFFLTIFILILALIVLYSLNLKTFQKEGFEEKRAKIVNEILLAIEDAESKGKYRCCIDPPCTMCYLGNWVWKDGICRCSDMLTKGEFDKVCPQCKTGIEEGKCKLTNRTICKT